MNREIKFRAWSEELLEMIYAGERSSNEQHWLDFRGSLLVLMEEQDEDYPREVNAVLMQFTGLKDKNGREIYEGDILMPDNIMVVWREELASFALRKDGWMYDHYFGEAIDAGHCEIIGNIFENPELLNNQSK